ncbi:MAG: tRNA lysidine(34) synthetase TilS [Siculibacillus sp.]|nr:tRNA lysidine(34) synthetase TilS [Siculibacillus sp.]
MQNAEDAPVSDAEAAKLFAPLRDRAGCILAVSGGPDSSALALLWARARTADPTLPPAVVVTVDHRLRPEAASEARAVAALATRLGLAHRTATRSGGTLAANLQAEARRARYDLLVDIAEDLGFDTIVTAHHAEDQAETFLARLARGSGVIGLAAMARFRTIDGLLLARPFLDLPRARLAATLRAAGEGWIDDPSNRDPRFDRVRLRAAAPLLADLGLTRDRLVATAEAMAAEATELDRRCRELLSGHGRLHPGGWISVCARQFALRDRSTRIRLIGRAIRAVGGADHAPRHTALEDLEAALTAGEARTATAARSLGRCRIERRGGHIWISPEIGRGEGRRLDLAPGERGRWCGRRVWLAAGAPAAATIAPLGRAGRLGLRDADPFHHLDTGWPTPAAVVVESAAAIFVAGELVAAPGLSYDVAGTVRWSNLVRFAPLETAFADTGVGSDDDGVR